MNNVLSFNKRQAGNYYWKEYDIAIKRLQCLKVDEYRGVVPSAEVPTFYPEPPILACKFALAKGYEHFVALANEDGNIAIQNTLENSGNSDRQIEGTTAHYNAIFDLAWQPNMMKLVTASGDHTLRLWSLAETGLREERVFSGHIRSVKTVVFKNDDSSVFASGARDGMINVWDTRAQQNLNLTQRPDNIINCSCGPHTPGSKSKKKGTIRTCCSKTNSITGLVFQDDTTLISCTAGDGIIKIWDLRKSYTTSKKTPIPKYTLPYAGETSRKGYTNLIVDQTAVRLYASCLDDTIYCFNIATYVPEPVMTYYGHEIQNSFYVKTSISADNLYLISGSSDENAYIWNIKNGKPLVRLCGHNAEVTCVAWCQTGDLKIITCADDSRHKIWRINDFDVNEACGHAEIPPVENILRTPHSNRNIKRQNENTPTFDTPLYKKMRYTNSRTGTPIGSSNSKRNRDTSDSSAECAPKRARRLFNPITESTNNGIDFPLKTIIEEGNISPIASTSTGLPSYPPMSNLPNFVVNGTAPHLRIISPQKRKENKDWISQYRKEIELRKRMINETTTRSPKQIKLDSQTPSQSPSSYTKSSNKKSHANSELNCVKNSAQRRPHSPLLKYFKVTANIVNNSTESHCNSTTSSDVSSTRSNVYSKCE